MAVNDADDPIDAGDAIDEATEAAVPDVGEDAVAWFPDEQSDPDAVLDEQAQAEWDAAMLERARRRHGGMGTILAAGMLGLEHALGRKPKEEIPIVVSSNSDPIDIDKSGISIDIDDDRTVVAPPMPRRDDGGRPRRARTKRRRET